MDGTILGQGTFIVGAGVPAVTVAIPSGADWMKVVNYTQTGIDGAANTGVEFLWQRGMPTGEGIVKYKTVAGVAALSTTTLTTGGFTLIDPNVIPLATTLTTTGGITADNPPVVTTTTTTPPVGSIVRMFPNNQTQIGGMDFTVTANVAATSFTLGNISLVNSTASTAGSKYQIIAFDPLYYPRRRFVTFIRAATQAVIYMSVTHSLTVGQEVRLSFPGGRDIWGNYAQLDGVQCSITAINVTRDGNEPNNGGTANNIQVDIDTSAFGAWDVFGPATNQAYPPSTLVPFTPAQVIPFGENSATSLNALVGQTPLDFFGNPINAANNGIIADATVNTAYLGMQLGKGGPGRGATLDGGVVTGPAGSVAADVMYWLAGKSTYGGQ